MKKTQLILFVLSAALLRCGGGIRDAAAIHQSALVADMHSDTALKMKPGFSMAERHDEGHMDIPRMREGGIDLQVFACWVATETDPDSCVMKIDTLIDRIETQVTQNQDALAICHTAAEAEQAIGESRIAAVIGIENGVAIAGDLDNLQHFYDRGVRYMTLTHTASSEWCISSADTAPAFHGLTDFGREVVHKMNEIGMIIDISHCSMEAVEEILKVTSFPVIASHSCVHALCEHDRNLTDDQIRAVAAGGGLIGINFYNGYLSQQFMDRSDSLWKMHRPQIDSLKELYAENDSLYRAAMKPIRAGIYAQLEGLVDVGTVVDHIDHIVKLVGPDHVGLGSDYDGVPNMPDGLEDCSGMPNITAELMRRGYNDEDIAKILGGNFMRVFREVCG
jgi:membrane dipeptidase